MRTLVELLQARAHRDRERLAFTFLNPDGGESSLAYGELDRRARSIAARLQRMAAPGDRALLVFPTGTDFISAFFGCLYAGVLAVPATYPKPRRPMPRLTAIARDSGAQIALTTAASLEAFDLNRAAPELASLEWLATDEIDADADDWSAPAVGEDDLAFLQYTSGSTSDPKGVMVSHANLLHNLEMILLGNGVRRREGECPARTGVFWLPAYHDMGLVCGILGTVYEAGHSVLMPPTTFLQRPLRWLEAVSKYRAEVSGAPNFAYELCVRKTTPRERESLDLSSWRVAFCSAEPVRAETLDRFAAAFAPARFQAEAFYPCYGLAEATLMAAGGEGPGRPVVKRVLREALAEHRLTDANGAADADVQTLVGCGRALHGQEIVIADPHTRRRCGERRVGEIWIRGRSVAQGYWRRPEESRQVFAATLADGGEGPFLRTGDLGSISDGQLFVTGRSKDVVIIRGRNHYPQDIERTIGEAHAALVFGAGAAFSIDDDGAERLVVVQELDRRHRGDDLSDVVRAIRRAVVEEHELDASAVVLIRQASLPRTTSGKVQRSLCRNRFLDGGLKVLHQWTSQRNGKSEAGPPQAGANGSGKSNGAESRSSARRAPPPLPKRNGRPLEPDEIDRLAEQIETWLVEWLVERAGVREEEVARDRPLADYGLDSLTAVELSQELEDWLGVQISTVVAWRYPTPATLSQYLAQVTAGSPAEAGEAAVVMRRRTVREFYRLLDEVEAAGRPEAPRPRAGVPPGE